MMSFGAFPKRRKGITGMLDYVDKVNVRPLINRLQHISVAERDRAGF